MTNKEFSYEFDILYNNIMSNQAPGLDDYEKSVFLTKAQEEIIINYYSGKNALLESFEKTEEIRRYLDTLVKSKYINVSSAGTEIFIPKKLGTEYHADITTDKDVWFIVYEVAIDNKNNIIPIVPVTHDELTRIIRNPFRRPTNNRILRVDTDNKVELISPEGVEIAKYGIRYIQKPKPIILSALPTGLEINGESAETSCELNSVIHRTILDHAVALAKAAWSGGTQNTIK